MKCCYFLGTDLHVTYPKSGFSHNLVMLWNFNISSSTHFWWMQVVSSGSECKSKTFKICCSSFMIVFLDPALSSITFSLFPHEKQVCVPVQSASAVPLSMLDQFRSTMSLPSIQHHCCFETWAPAGGGKGAPAPSWNLKKWRHMLPSYKIP